MPIFKKYKYKISDETRGVLFISLSAILYGLLGFLGTKLLSASLTVENMLFWRFFIAVIWLFMVMLFYRRDALKGLSQLMRGWKLILLGIVCYSASSGFYFLASKYIGTGIAMVIFFSYPIFVFLFCWFSNGWKSSFINMASLLFVCLGLFLLKGEGNHSITLIGLFFATVAALAYAIYVYGSQFNAKTTDTFLLTLLICVGNTCLFFLLTLSTHSLQLPSDLSAWAFALAIGILATALPIQLLLEGLKFIAPTNASILSVFEPIVTVLIGVALLNESVSTLQSIGILIVLIAAMLIQFDRIARP